MSIALFGFLLLFAMIAIPMVLLVAVATERAPAVAPAPRSERVGLALVVLCFVIPIIIAALHSAVR
jgi:hypothetical protein